MVAYWTEIGRQLQQNDINTLHNNAGIYCKNQDHLISYINKTNQCIEHSTALAQWGPGLAFLYPCEQHFIKKYKLPTIPFQILEPFYCIEEGFTPWSHSLLGKKVLVINSFVESMQQQIQNKFTIYKDKHVFLDGQEFIFYKSYVTFGFNTTHDNWVETFDIMCDDISKLDFDIALLGCGGYGLPLCDFIYSKLNKSAIYIGGGIQLLFGVMGKRWENNEMWKRIIAENDTKFIRPNENEKLKNQTNIEGGCYW